MRAASPCWTRWSRSTERSTVCTGVWRRLRGQAGQGIPMNLNAGSAQRIAFTRHEPIGVVLAFSAFNHPVNLIVHQVFPGVAAGCPVIVKPAEATPLSCMRLVSNPARGGPAAGVVPGAADLGSGRRRAGSWATRESPSSAFIGSARVGWMLRSQLAPGTRCSLEHGGAAPVVVAPDADLDEAVPVLTKGGFYHSGQVCVSVQRVFAHSSLVASLAERLARRAPPRCAWATRRSNGRRRGAADPPGRGRAHR